MNFGQKGKDDFMMYCVTCNKASLFAPRLKTSKKQGYNKHYCGTRIFLNVVEARDSDSFLYETESIQYI